MSDFAIGFVQHTTGVHGAHERRLQEWATTTDSPFSQWLQEDYFIQVQLDPEAESLVWPNGLDFCPDMLYLWAVGAQPQLHPDNITNVELLDC